MNTIVESRQSMLQWAMGLKSVIQKSTWIIEKNQETDVSFTTFFAENKEEFGSTVLDVSVNVCHKTDQFVPQSTAHLWPVLHITQWGQHLNTHTHTHLNMDTRAIKTPTVLIIHLFIMDSLCLIPVLTIDLRNFLVSRWMRALSVSRFSDGRRVSFSLCPWEIEKQTFIISVN